MNPLWILAIAGAGTVLGVLTTMMVRSGRGSPGVPTHLHPHDHDEPKESVAKPLDTPRHGESGLEQAGEYKDMRRTLGDR